MKKLVAFEIVISRSLICNNSLDDVDLLHAIMIIRLNSEDLCFLSTSLQWSVACVGRHKRKSQNYSEILFLK